MRVCSRVQTIHISRLYAHIWSVFATRTQRVQHAKYTRTHNLNGGMVAAAVAAASASSAYLG